MYKAVIIGLGKAGWELDKDLLRREVWSHYQAYDLCSDTKLTAGYDVNKIQCDKFTSWSGIKTYDSLKEMLTTEEPEIVSICTPTSNHLNDILACLEYPSIRAIFCEKPLTFSSRMAELITNLCHKNKVVLAVNYMRRWDNLYLKIKKIIDNGELGELKSVVGITNTSLYMSASHMIDLIIMLCGDMKILYGGRVDNFHVRMVHGSEDRGGFFHFNTINGVEGFLHAYCDSVNKHQFEISLNFSNGRIISTGDGVYNSLFKYEPSRKRKGLLELSPYNGEFINFQFNERMVDAVQNICNVLNGKETIINCTGEDAIKSIKFIEECLR